jgi:hypothetical protein
LKVRDFRKPVPPVLSVILSDVSLTETLQEGLKIQFIAGALTLTIFSAAAFAASGVRQIRKANKSLFRIIFLYRSFERITTAVRAMSSDAYFYAHCAALSIHYSQTLPEKPNEPERFHSVRLAVVIL